MASYRAGDRSNDDQHEEKRPADALRNDTAGDDELMGICDFVDHDHNCNHLVLSSSFQSASTRKTTNTRRRRLLGRPARPSAVQENVEIVHYHTVCKKTFSNASKVSRVPELKTKKIKSPSVTKKRKINRTKVVPSLDGNDISGLESNTPGSEKTSSATDEGEERFFDAFKKLFLSTRDGGKCNEGGRDGLLQMVFV